MTSSNIATLTQNQILRSRILDIQTELLRAQVQASTGKKTDVFSGLRSEARTSISLNNAKETVETFQQTISITKARMDTMQSVFARISDIAVEVRNTALQVSGIEATPSGSASATLKSLAASRLKEIATLLNTKINGRQLFAGQRLATPPLIDPGAVGAAGTPLNTVSAAAPALANTVASGQARYVNIAGAKNTASATAAAGATVINLTSPPNGVQVGTQIKFAGQPTVYTVAVVGPGNSVAVGAPGPLNLVAAVASGESVSFLGQVDENAPALYYQGATTGAQVSARIEDGTDLEYGVRGDDPAFASLLGALYALATTDLTTANETGYRELARLAINDLDDGFDQLQQKIGVLGVRQDTLDQTNQRHSDTLLVIQTQITDVEDVDAADVLTRITLLQTNLESSFRLLASTQDLSLINFL